MFYRVPDAVRHSEAMRSIAVSCRSAELRESYAMRCVRGTGEGERFAMTAHLKHALTREALLLGFDCIGVSDPAATTGAAHHFRAFIDSGGHGDMDWLAAQPER